MNSLVCRATEGKMLNKIELYWSDLGGTPIIKAKLDCFEDAGQNGFPDRKTIRRNAELIAEMNGCSFNGYGDYFFAIVRHPRDIRLGNVPDYQDIYESVDGAQKDFCKLYAPYYVRFLVDILQCFGLEILDMESSSPELADKETARRYKEMVHCMRTRCVDLDGPL